MEVVTWAEKLLEKSGTYKVSYKRAANEFQKVSEAILFEKSGTYKVSYKRAANEFQKVREAILFEKSGTYKVSYKRAANEFQKVSFGDSPILIFVDTRLMQHLLQLRSGNSMPN